MYTIGIYYSCSLILFMMGIGNVILTEYADTTDSVDVNIINKYLKEENEIVDRYELIRFDKSNIQSKNLIGEKESKSSQRNKLSGEESNFLYSELKLYILRYINLFLYELHLKNKVVSAEANEELKLNFDFIISAKDLITLKHLSNDLNEKNILDGLNEIDSILQKGLHLREDSLFQQILNFFRIEDFKGFSLNKTYFHLCFLISIPVLFLFKKCIGLSNKFVILTTINNLILLEGVMNYLNKLKEADIQDYVEMLPYAEEPAGCREKLSFFSKIFSWFGENECVKYHKLLQTKRTDTIFPLESILDTYSFYLLEMPSKVIGNSIKIFAVALNDYLPPVFALMGTSVTINAILVSVLFLALCLMGIRFKFKFFGSLIEIGSAGNRNDGALPLRARSNYFNRILEVSKEATSRVKEIRKNTDSLENLKGPDSISEIIDDEVVVKNDKEDEECHAEGNKRTEADTEN